MLGLSFPLFAADSHEILLKEGNTLYEAGKYKESAEVYESIIEQGMSSATLHYNLGNAYYRLGKVAQSILHYERSLKLDPSQEDVIFNLRLANLKVVDNIEPLPEFLFADFFNGTLNSRSSGQWGIVTLVFLWAALGLGLAFLFAQSPVLKRVGFFGGFACLGLALFLLFVSWRKYDKEHHSREAIVTAANAYVKASPDASAQDLLILHEGVKLDVRRGTGEWTEISLSDSKAGKIVGWMETKAMEEI